MITDRGGVVSERKRRPARWRRRAVIAALSAVVLGGTTWRCVAIRNAEPWFASLPTRDSALGTWTMEDPYSGHVSFIENGRFSAVDLPIGASTNWQFTGAGTWLLANHGRSVVLQPDHPTPDMDQRLELSVVRSAGHLRLCVLSGSPGVLCDFLLHRTTGVA